MKRFLRLSPEHVVYLILWPLVFLMPLAICYLRVRIDPQAEFRWIEVFHIWGWLAIYLFFFLVHNYLIAPQLLRKQRKLYVAFVALMVLTFTLFNGWFGPKMHDMRPPRPQNEAAKMEKPKHHKRYYHGFMLGPDVPINIMVLLGIIGINIGVKLYFKSETDRANLQQLEKERIFLQLQYLRFQINPHFFMNTLNNIQVLIDMDAEKAKASLRDLSVMMRFVLYDGGRDWVLLQREAAFLHKYIQLMRLRYTDRLMVTVDIPDNLPDGKVPPLIFGTFVENAFKHGVSYRQDSFITVTMDVEDDKLIFGCVNSKKEEAQETNAPQESGMGLSNVRRRLDLIYGNDYSLDITDGDIVYDVSLRIPLHKDQTA